MRKVILTRIFNNPKNQYTMNIEQLELLKSDVVAFNEFRRNNPETEINLSGADLSYANLSDADLRGADLSGADLSGADLSDANLSGANLSDANLSYANLSGANLDMSCLPLWCGSLRMKTDSRLRVQVAFHFASLIANCKNATDEEKKIYNDILDYVNKFHREDVDRLQPIQ